MKTAIGNRESGIVGAGSRGLRGLDGGDRATRTSTARTSAGCADSRFAIADARLPGFSLIELLVALAVFAALAAAAYGGLAAIARTRGALAVQQDRFAALGRTVSALERDLRQAVARPVLGNDGVEQPALVGSADGIELSRLGYANPLAEPRSNVERVVYTSERGTLRRGRYAALDRAPNSLPLQRELLVRAGELHLRYYGCDRIWREAWPPREPLACQVPATSSSAQLPRAVEFRFSPPDLGEIRRVVELPSPLPLQAASAKPRGDTPPPAHGDRPQPPRGGGA